jgi:hypothetical protein
MRTISRAAAQQRGLKRYFTGRPCIHGHISERWVSTKGCRQCVLEWTQDWQEKNPDEVAAKNARFRDTHPEYAGEWRRANVEKANLYRRRWRARRNGWPLEPLPTE